MKSWLKRHGKVVFCAFGIVVLCWLTYCIWRATRPEVIALGAISIALWVCLLVVMSGLFNKLYDWWEKD